LHCNGGQLPPGGCSATSGFIVYEGGPVERVAVFIDGSNFYHGCRNVLPAGSNVDFTAFARKLVGTRQLVRVYFYTAVVRREDDEDMFRNQQRFLERLDHLEYFQVKLGRLVPRHGTVVEKGVVINIAVDMLKYAHSYTYDTAVLVTGDGDFATAVEAVKDLGKHVENAYFRSGRSQELQRVCDRFIELGEAYLRECMLRARP
jgi:uncharacterized LabA/DUF88 family protein